MRAAAITLALLALVWPAWLATGWLADRLAPEGTVLLLRAALLLLLLDQVGGLVERREDRRQGGEGHG
ncbi:hypothetical protein [Falsiroseomonas tokyonensis]|uniref:Uncharacterized protein n=1 Tax=Falsiroseomonas tokyonensis TaxID=430521 RepID=A0ABV7BV79_9PROT|nr:hypothetical protein [Falsiroseomonas tokyonensis]MBU8538396.1 hypothetical protein [Falsiroseomonas tokyonensis]